jgi:dTDP-glucose 4,6-dehydratase
MKVLVTGSEGFVGKNLVEHLKKNQLEVVGLDKNADYNRSDFYRLGSFDVDPEELLRGSDAVIHLASESHVDRSIDGPRVFVENNVLGTLELFQAVKNYKPDIPIILFSTDEVGACLDRGWYVEKGQAFHCGSVYSATKGAQELLAQAYSNTHNLHIITTRCVNIFGKHQADEKFIPTVVKNALLDQQIPIYGSGLQLRQWVSVEHVCQFLNDLVVSTCIPPESVLHITGTHEVPNILMAHTILNFLNKPSSLIQHVTDRLGHDTRYSLGRTEETDRFGFAVYDKENFMSDLKETVFWYSNQFSLKNQRGRLL